MGLKDKASKINFALPAIDANAAGTSAELGEAEIHRPRTAPGRMMEFSGGQRSELLRENDALRDKAEKADELRGRLDEALTDLKGWEGAKAARLLDPALIRPSVFANRDPRSFASAEFVTLKAEVASAGGNVQPIKVRPFADGGYEVVYGHRRLQACRELGLPVLALVDSIDDRALFVEMDRENRERQDLSPWEQGVMYQRALAKGLFPSNRKLADAVGADLGAVGKALSLASLPEEVVAAFPSPLEIQYRWAKPLKDVLEADSAGVLARAKALHEKAVGGVEKLAARQVFDQLVAASPGGVEPFNPPAPTPVMRGDERVGSVKIAANGALSIDLAAGVLPGKKVGALVKAIEAILKAS